MQYCPGLLVFLFNLLMFIGLTYFDLFSLITVSCCLHCFSVSFINDFILFWCVCYCSATSQSSHAKQDWTELKHHYSRSQLCLPFIIQHLQLWDHLPFNMYTWSIWQCPHPIRVLHSQQVLITKWQHRFFCQRPPKQHIQPKNHQYDRSKSDSQERFLLCHPSH